MPPGTDVPTETTNAPDLSGICDGVDIGFLEHPSDCGLAIFCFNQEKILRECGDGQIFDVRFGM